jgi:hypothetical protein
MTGGAWPHPALVGLAAALPAGRPALPIATADRALLARVMADNRVDQHPEPPPASYFYDLLTAVMDRIVRWVSRVTAGVHLPVAAAKILAIGLLVAAAGLLVLLATRLWRIRRARLAPLAAATRLAPAGEPEWDAATWRRVRDRALAEGQLAEALTATWWWLARTVGGNRADAAWTGRDLLAATRRADLRAPIAALERLLYGPRGPELEAVRQLITQLEERLA